MTSSPKRHAAPLLVALLFLSTGIAACKKVLDVRHNQAYIIGTTSDIHSVDRDTEAKIDPDVLHAAVLIATHLSTNSVKFCSGTLISGEMGGDNYRILSNHHCFARADADGKATTELMPEACTATTVYFGFLKGQTREALPIPCKEGSLRTNFDGDLSVFSLSKNPPDVYKPLQFWDGDESAEGRTALIVHYPDVEDDMAQPVDGGPKLPTAAATINDCKVLGLFAVSEWDLDRTLPYSLRHTCDLIHGSSGSGLIDAQTGKLLGVNWGGIKISLDSGVRTDNVATRARFAQAFLSNSVDDEIKLAAERRIGAQTRVSTRDDTGSFKNKSQAVSETVKKRCGVAGGPSLASLLVLCLTLLAPLARAAAAPAAVRPIPVPPATPIQAPVRPAPSPAVAWATSYLLNAAFLAAYEAIAGSATEADKKTLKARASFALASARAKVQALPLRAPLDSELMALKADDGALISAGFDAALQPHWTRLSDYYRQPSPACSIDADDVKEFAEHQKSLLSGDRGLNPQALLEPVLAWDLGKIQCLVFALAASTDEAKIKDGYDPIHLLAALQQTGSPLMKDEALRAMAALRFLQHGQYAETLRTLMDMSDAEPAYRLAYDVVQRVFSARQKGEGAVALQGL